MYKNKGGKKPFAVCDSGVFSLAVSPNGRHLAIGLENGTIEIWDLRGYCITKSSTSHNAAVRSVAFSPDGQIIVSGSEDKTIILWDLKGNPIAEPLQGHEDVVYSVAFHPYKEIIASSSEDYTIRLWNLEGNPISEPFQGHEGVIFSIVFSPNGEIIASGAGDGTIRLWNLEGNPISEPFQGHEGAVYSIAFSPDGKMIISGGGDDLIRLWDLEGNSITSPFEGHNHYVFSVIFSLDGKMIVSASNDQTIRLWDLEGNSITLPLEGHKNTIYSIAFIPNKQMIVSGSYDQTVRLWDINTGEELEKLPPKVNFVGQTPKNDLAAGEDKLNIKNEIYALAEVLMLRDLEPPLAVGILGGWGSGKSYAMNLIQRRINEIRSLDLNPIQTWGNPEDFQKNQLSPYVGHIYQIRFDAWTYAKTDLWSSLMQTIFYEFNRQLTLERQLEKAGWNLLEGGTVWQALNEINDEEREELLSQHLQDKFEIWKQQTSNNETVNILWETLTQLRESEKQVLTNIEQDLHNKRVELETIKIKAEEQAKNELAESSEACKHIKDKLINIFGESFQNFLDEVKNSDQTSTSGQLKKEDIELIEFAVKEFKPTIWDSVKELWEGSKQDKKTIVVFFICLLFTILTPFFFTQLGAIFQTLGTLLAFFFTFLPSSANLLKQLQKTNEFIKNQLSYYQKIVEDEKQSSENLHEKIMQKHLQQSGVVEQETEIKKLEIQAENQRQKIGLTANYTSLVDFVDARIEKNIYGKRLGILQQVQRDLMDLTAHFTLPREYWRYYYSDKVANLQKFFPRGQARIVLYIDDLDRCPPQRVVEVLEAVQLLLKTPLFIVVIAIDDRYIARALEDVYKGVLKRKGNPSGIDYLEKIIQIPYRMRPISYLNLRTYLESQIEIEGQSNDSDSEIPEEELKSFNSYFDSPRLEQEAPSHPAFSAEEASLAQFSQSYDYQPIDFQQLPQVSKDELEDELETISEVTKFSAEEFQILENCCKHVDLSPRTAKRLINIYKILKIVWSRYQSMCKTEPNKSVKKLIMAFLALSGRYPHLMRGLFEIIDMYFEQIDNQDQEIDVKNIDFKNILNDVRKPIPSNDYYYQREWQKFEHDVKKMLQSIVGDESITLNKETFSLMLSFCFIGDIGYDPDDFRAEFSTNGKGEGDSNIYCEE
ncbi:MAG TPA: P-loop NTPase fold protein [Nostocaceae cyanobacterium]|nr:P-loop NTPase fold protein [Nostocaceae cyanobacterium]